MFLKVFTLQRSHTHIGSAMHRRPLFGLMALTVFSLLAQAPGTHAATVIPETAGDGPVGIILEGQYTRFDGRSLLGPPVKDETAPQRLVRRYAQLTASKDKDALRELYFVDDGSKARVSPLLDQLEALRPAFRLSGATLIEELQWDGLTVHIMALRGVPVLIPERAPLLSVCPNAPRCYLLFPQFGPQNQQFETLDTVLRLFSKYSTPATSAQRQVFLASNPLVVRLKPDSAYADLADVPVEVKMLVEPYVNVPPTTAEGEPPPAWESRPELNALFELLRRLKALDESEITDDNDAFREMLNQAFHAEYAADVSYGVNRQTGAAYVVDSLSAADFVKAIRSWRSVEPACAVRHGDTVFVYVRVSRGEEPQSLQLFPVKVVNDRGSFEALRFANYLVSLLQIPQLLTEVEKSCAGA